jgi:glutamate-1-semialdehyde 2,1-aminomutase
MSLNFSRSKELFAKAKTLIPGGVNSPVRAFNSVHLDPIYMREGVGSQLFDEDGNDYIDFCMSWGPLIHGHSHPKVTESIIEAAKTGSSFGTVNYREIELAELIINNHKYIDQIRFVSSGTEATMSAIRLARSYTGKSKIIKFEGCYHGHADHLLVKAGSGLATLGLSSSSGVPQSFTNETIVLDLNNKAQLEEAFKKYKNEIAAIIVEPIPANNGLLIQDKEYLKFLREITQRENSLLIFDEVISGFRIGFEGAAGLYNIKPDIITFGKIIGGGLPVGAYAGKLDIMSNVSPNGSMYQAGTLSGNPIAMAAGKAQLDLCLENNFYKNLEIKASAMKTSLNDYLREKSIPAKLHQIGSILWFSFSDLEEVKVPKEIPDNAASLFDKFYVNCIENKIYLGPSAYEVFFLSSVHSDEDLKYAAEVFKKSLSSAFGI